MRDPAVIAAMAEASLLQGAAGVRLESPEHIGAVRRRCPDALIVGLWKRSFPGSPVYITPGWRRSAPSGRPEPMWWPSMPPSAPGPAARSWIS